MIKGILTNAWKDEESCIELKYEIKADDKNKRIFYLLNGVTGYESFYIDHEPINSFIDLFQADIKKMCKNGWLACAGTKNKYDKLFIPPEEMQKALITICDPNICKGCENLDSCLLEINQLEASQEDTGSAPRFY